MFRWSKDAVPCILVLACLGGSISRADATPDILAFAGFEADPLGATARPLGPPSVQEELFDDGPGTGGVSEVEACAEGKRYRLSESANGGTRAILLPLSEVVCSGTLTVSAIVTADQEGAGGVFSAQGPDESEWFLHVGFGADGRFRCHDQATQFAYAVGGRYQVLATLRFGSPTTVDYDIEELFASHATFSLHDVPVTRTGAIEALRFATEAAGEASFSIDELVAVR